MQIPCREVVIRRPPPDMDAKVGDRVVLPLDTCNELVARRIARWGRPGFKPQPIDDEPESDGEREEDLDTKPSAEGEVATPEPPVSEPSPRDSAPTPEPTATPSSTPEPPATAADPLPVAPTEAPSWATVRAMAHADARALVERLVGSAPFGWEPLEAHYTAWLAAQTEAADR